MPIGIRDLRCNRIWKARCHRREIARKREELVAANVDVARYPTRDRAAVRADDRIVREQLVQLVRDDLGLDRSVLARSAIAHETTPFLHTLLAFAQEAAGAPPHDERH